MAPRLILEKKAACLIPIRSDPSKRTEDEHTALVELKEIGDTEVDTEPIYPPVS